MRKSFITLAVTAALVISNITPAFAAYIVAPPETEGQSFESMTWGIEEVNRWEERLINTYAENIKSTTREDSVDRLNAVIKAVADYTDTVSGDYALDGAKVYQFRDGQLSASTMVDYVYILGKAVGLDVYSTSGFYRHGIPIHVTVCDIDGATYWGDAWMYASTNDAQWLASTTQLSFFETADQRVDRIAKEQANLQYDESYTSENGQVSICIN